MIRIRSGVWLWQLLDEQPFLDLGRHPEELTADTVPVKRNAVRAVFRRNGYYLKITVPNRLWSTLREALAPKARAEFRTAQQLAAAGIPVVEHLGFGCAGGNNLLITRAFPESVPALDYAVQHLWRNTDAAPEFLPGLAACWRNFLDSGFFHPDLHLGNLLYQPESGHFALVDLAGVRRRHPTAARRRTMCRGLFDLRELLGMERFRTFTADCGLPPAEFDALYAEVRARAAAEWPRRRRQFLQGYEKYVAEGDGVRCFRDLDRALRTTPEARTQLELQTGTPEALEQLALAGFRLDLMQLPHPRIAALEPKAGKLYREPWTALPELGPELRRELALWGIPESAVRPVRDCRGREGVLPLHPEAFL